MRIVMSMAAASLCIAATTQAQEVRVKGPEGSNMRNHLVYAGIGFGPTQLKTSGQSREVDGIDFSFSTEAKDAGGALYVGGWITDHVGAEIGTRNYGTIDVPFEFFDPHDNSSGTGESQVSITGVNLALMAGVDLTRNIPVVGRVGVLFWKEEYDSRFDIPGEPAIDATTEASGSGPMLGVGASCRVSPGWQIDARYEFATLDEDTISLMTIGLAYDFVALAQR